MAFEQIPPPYTRPKVKKEESRFEEFPEITVNNFFIKFIKDYENQIRNGDVGIVANDLDPRIWSFLKEISIEKGKEYSVLIAREIRAGLETYHIAYKDVDKNEVDFEKDHEAKQKIKDDLREYVESGGENIPR